MTDLHAPFPYMGGKRRVARKVWAALGNPRTYVEPFAGSLGVLLGRPRLRNDMIEHISDLDGHVANFWRSTRLHPSLVKEAFDRPPVETELRAWWRVRDSTRESMQAALEEDDRWCDPEMAGRWAWAMSLDFAPQLGASASMVTRRQGVEVAQVDLMQRLAVRLRRVRVWCGDWERAILRSRAIEQHAALFLDPPYDASVRSSGLYAAGDDGSVAARCVAWALDHAYLRIVVAGYEDEHCDTLRDWRVLSWSGGLASGATSAANRHKERLWLSPACNGR